MSDAIFTTCFLINRRSSLSLDDKIHYASMFPNESLFHDTPHVFGLFYTWLVSRSWQTIGKSHQMCHPRILLSSKMVLLLFFWNKKVLCACKFHFFVEETSFFPSLHKVDSIQHVSPIPTVVEPLFFPAHDNSPSSYATSNPLKSL